MGQSALRVTGCGLRVTRYKFRVTGCEFRVIMIYVCRSN